MLNDESGIPIIAVIFLLQPPMYPSNNGNGQPFQATSGNTTANQFSYNYNGGQVPGGAAGTWQNNYPGYSQQYNQQHWQQQPQSGPNGQPVPQQSWNNSGAWPNPGGGQPQQQQQPQQQNQQKGCDNYQRTFDYVQQCQNWTNAQ